MSKLVKGSIIFAALVFYANVSQATFIRDYPKLYEIEIVAIPEVGKAIVKLRIPGRNY